MHLLLVDGSSIFYPGFHKYRRLVRSDGLAVGGVYGLTQALIKLLSQMERGGYPPTHIAVCWESPSRRYWRHDIYPEYKANRAIAKARDGSDIRAQSPYVTEALEAFGIKSLAIDGLEADDIIATYADLALAVGTNVTIASVDKDLLQLVRPGVIITDKGKIITEEVVICEYGLMPRQIPHLLALAGDASDGIPGIPSIGTARAKAMLQEFGDINGIYDNLKTYTPHTVRLLEKHRSQVWIFHQLIHLRPRYDLVATDLHALEVEVPPPDQIIRFCNKMEFPSLVRRMENRALVLDPA